MRACTNPRVALPLEQDWADSTSAGTGTGTGAGTTLSPTATSMYPPAPPQVGPSQPRWVTCQYNLCPSFARGAKATCLAAPSPTPRVSDPSAGTSAPLLLQPTQCDSHTHLQRRRAERKHNLRRSADEAAQIDEHVHAAPIDRRRRLCGTFRAEVSPRLGRFLDPLLPLRPVRAAPESAVPSGCPLGRERACALVDGRGLDTDCTRARSCQPRHVIAKPSRVRRNVPRHGFEARHGPLSLSESAHRRREKR